MKITGLDKNIDDGPIILKLADFAKISAVEGIALTENSKAMFVKFEASGMPKQERLNHILQKHRPKG